MVDDDEEDYFLTKYLFDEFKDKRYVLEWTNDCEHALEAMNSDAYDIYLVDYRMGEYNGLDILRQAVASGCCAPIVLMTGQGDQEVDNQAMEAGAADYLIKGEVESVLLERMIRYSLRHARTLEAIQNSERSLRESKERYRALFENANDVIYVHDLGGNFTSVNQTGEKLFGYTHQEILKLNIKQIVAPEDLQIACDRMAEKLAGKASTNYELTCLRKDGKRISFEVNSRIIYDGNTPLAVQGIARDITDRKLAEEERDRLYNVSNDLLATIGFDGRLLHINPAWEKILGYKEGDLIGKPIGEITHPADLEINISETNKLNAGQNISFESRLLCKDGTYRWILWNSTPIVAEKIYYAVGRNITERKEAEEVLQRSALYDTLTGLPNRAQFMNHLRTATEKFIADPSAPFAVLFLDLDRFKIINDGLGHSIGDKLLISIAERIKASLRPGDIVARLGGDEFTLLIHNVKQSYDATNVAERIQKQLAKPFRLDNYEVFSSASIGIIIADETHRQPEDFLRDADSAMYRAKESGKARYEIFDHEMHIRNMNLLQIETDLRKALERNEFRLFYQPIVCLENGMIEELETLLRWQHPRYGLILPNEFIHVAEETGLIISIGEWVIREACRQTKYWQRNLKGMSELSISVNLSAKQLMHPSLIAQIKNILVESELDIKHLKFEVTESTVMENSETALQVLNELNSHGVNFSTDDFGTGYSSLSYLHQYPFKRIKIDRSFIGKMDADEKSEDIIRTILMLGQNLGLEVVAEGIENEVQLLKLRAIGCSFGQGYFFSKPTDCEFTEKLLLKGLPKEFFKPAEFLAQPRKILSGADYFQSEIES